MVCERVLDVAALESRGGQPAHLAVGTTEGRPLQAAAHPARLPLFTPVRYTTTSSHLNRERVCELQTMV
ncbi:Hypp6307 [Branchiostoma lanceolatum]|uniref:Hypp6307 protein n=1 Tax=Branchiostoma lanceolatum TaxID=7740 RepID=A0A8J9YSV9_BRALA|nr:Hypp6307 [Branchiostoma lanceolatum]